MTEVSEGMMFELTATHKLLPKLVRVVQVDNDKAWFVDDPRTLRMPRYMRTAGLLENYREVKNKFEMMSTEPRKFWMITGDGNAPKVRHYNRKEAVSEAERLARAYPGVEFFVLETVEMMTQPIGFVRHKF